MLTAFAASVQTTTAWVDANTHLPDMSATKAGAAMQAGEEVSIAVSLQLRNKTTLDSLTAALIAGTSAKTISSAEFLTKFAPTQAEVDAVVAHLVKSGFVNIDVAPNHLMITANGSASAVQAAFKVNLQHFTVKDRNAYAFTSNPEVPQTLRDIIQAVHGLQTVNISPPNLVRAGTNTSSSGQVGHSPAAWPVNYNATGIPAASNAPIGIIADGNMTQTLKDLAIFVSQNSFARPVVSTVIVGGAGKSTLGGIDSQGSPGAADGAVKSMAFYAAKSMSDAASNVTYNAAVPARISAAKLVTKATQPSRFR